MPIPAPHRSVHSFPHLSQDEFSAACRAGKDGVLIIEKTLGGPSEVVSQDATAGDEEVGLEDVSDNEALIRVAKPCEPFVEFNILLSSTYQVPVLWFNLRSLPAGGPKGIDAVYRWLIPKRYRAELRQFGIAGGITMANHPLTDIPAYFIHPCNTADAMREVASGKALTPEEYMLAWLGLVGGFVGLHVPSELLADPKKQTA